MNALQALGRGFLDLFRPKILLLLFLPPVIAFIIWVGTAYIYWEPILNLARSYGDRFLFSGDIPPWILESLKLDPADVAATIAATVAVLFILPLTLVTSMGLTAVMAMPVVLSTVAIDYPNLERKGSVNLAGTLKNIFISTLIYLVLWVVTLPLWVIPGLGFALPLIINGYLNYRLFTYDALSSYANPIEIEILIKEHRRDFLLLGMVLSIPLLLVVTFFIMPVYNALVFSRYSLMKLEKFRQKTP